MWIVTSHLAYRCPTDPPQCSCINALRVATGCTRCPELVANRRCIVHGYGPHHARIVFIGEAPGYKGGDQTGVPFTRDRSGVRLQQLLISLELSDESDPRSEQPRLHCFLTNVVRCNPPANRTPTRVEISNCQPHLWQELSLLQADIVIPVGNIATQAVFPRLLGRPALPIGRVHAQILTHAGGLIVPMRHPARVSNVDLERFRCVLHSLLSIPDHS